MKTNVPKGRYVVAVSGGVDSVTLLDLLSNLPHLDLIVAHFNHGIRPNSLLDEELVRNVSKRYNLLFEVGYGHLGADASEEQARVARYKFLNQVKEKYKADKIITAHHQDDLIETAFLNILRGTGRRGLTSIFGNHNISRPLMGFSKKEIVNYARENNLRWHDDPTNEDEKYLRNYIRKNILTKLTPAQRTKFIDDLDQMAAINKTIDQEIENLSQNIVKGDTIDRAKFTALPIEIANEVLIHFFRNHGILEFDKRTIERLSIAIKTAKPGSKHDILKGLSLRIDKSAAVLVTTD